MSLSVGEQEIMGEWYEGLCRYLAESPPQLRDYAVARSWAYRTWMPRARGLVFGRAMMDFVLSSKFLELGPPQPAATIATVPPAATYPHVGLTAGPGVAMGRFSMKPPLDASPPADPSVDRAHTRWMLGLALACAAVLGGLAGRGGLKDEVIACIDATTSEAAKVACPDWMQRP